MKTNLFLLLTILSGCESYIYYKHTILNESDYDLPILIKIYEVYQDTALIKSHDKKKVAFIDNMGKPSTQYFNEYRWHFVNGARNVDTLYIASKNFILTKDYRDSTNWIPDISETLFTMTINNQFFITNSDLK